MNGPAEKHFGEEPFPRKPLFGAAALVLLALGTVTASRFTKVGAPVAPDPAAPIIAERALHFEDRADGGITILDASNGALVENILPGSNNNFMRGTLRSLVRERRRESIGSEQPFKLTARQDGRLLLTDPATGEYIDLGSFGPTNAEAFGALLTAKETMPTQTASVVEPKS